jgi:hypothetical protein
MNKTNLLLSTAVGLAFVVAGPSAMAVGKKHTLPGDAKAHAAVNMKAAERAGFKRAHNDHGKPNHLKPRQTIDTWAAPTASITLQAGAFTPEDAATTVNCLKACRVVTENTAELLSYYSYNQIAICPVVDGYFTNGSCYFSGALSPKEQYTNRTNQTNLDVAAGSHVLQTYVYVVAPAYLGHYQNDYHLYQAHAPR